MRAVSQSQLAYLSPVIEELKAEPKDESLVNAIKELPAQLAEAFKNLPVPKRPQGSWVIEVNRDNSGQMSNMIANFHETI